MRKRLLPALAAFVALVLELLPSGAVLNFADPWYGTMRRTYSYFSLTPFGYANFGPFCTALLTVVLAVLAALFLARGEKKTLGWLCAVSVLAVLTSLAPLLCGPAFLSFTGMLITASLAVLAASALWLWWLLRR